MSSSADCPSWCTECNSDGNFYYDKIHSGDCTYLTINLGGYNQEVRFFPTRYDTHDAVGIPAIMGGTKPEHPMNGFDWSDLFDMPFDAASARALAKALEHTADVLECGS